MSATTATSALAIVQVAAIKALVDLLADLDLSPLHLQIDAKTAGNTTPDIRLWMQTRTDFEALCAALKVKPKEARFSPQGQRHWSAEHDNAERRLLVQVVSFEHHADWQEKQR